MKISKSVALACVILGGLPIAAQAASPGPAAHSYEREGWFVGAGVGYLTLDDSEGFSTSMTHVHLQGGWRFNRFFSVDARIGTSFSSTVDIEDEDLALFLPEVELSIPTYYGVYARGILPVSERWDLYAQAGYIQTKLKASVKGTEIGTISASDSQGSFSYGVGASWFVTPRFILDFEYQPALVDGSLFKADSFGVSFRTRF